MTKAPTEPPLQQVASDLFRDFKGDEIGGRHAIRGFSFQVWHAVLEALRAHRTGDDYAVVLEWQQDIAILDSSDAPTGARFVQLKKHEASTHWKLNHLIASPKGKDEDAQAVANGAHVAEAGDAVAAPPAVPASSGKAAKSKAPKKPKPSILAKLYAHRRRFQTLGKLRLEFSSDARFEMEDATGGTSLQSSIELASTAPSVQQAIEAKLREQLGLDPAELVDFSDFALVVSDCPVHEPHKYLAGELAQMQLESDLNLSGKATILAVLIIASYVYLKAGTTRHAKDFAELLERAVTRGDIDLYLAAADKETVSPRELVDEIIEWLKIEAAPFSLVRDMRKEVVRACMEITNRAGPVPVITAHLKSLYESKSEYGSRTKVTEILSAWFEDFNQLQLSEARHFSREYIYCLMSMIIQDANPTKQLPSLPTGPQPEDSQ
jgi:Cap4 dsDNA endonuclease